MALCVIFEDDHLLVVNKPAGMNTHAPGPFAGEGLYEWLRDREPRWARLAIIHRLDKETSGAIVFTKTDLANRSLTEQFTHHRVRKKYVFLTDHLVPSSQITVKSCLVRTGEKYVSRPGHSAGAIAETKFGLSSVPASTASLAPSDRGHFKANRLWMVEAEPLTGRTHQIRVHAAAKAFPILGDTLYGGTAASRVYLHAASLSFQHPATGETIGFDLPINFSLDSRRLLREAMIAPEISNAYRLIHGASDGWPGWYVDRLGEFLLSQGPRTLDGEQRLTLQRLMDTLAARGAYHKPLTRQVSKGIMTESSPQLLLGRSAPEGFAVRENGVQFEVRFGEGHSIGLFLDQRENRRRLLCGQVAAGFQLLGQDSQGEQVPRPQIKGETSCNVLNTFAYTCSFSVCAAKAGLKATSIDLSKKYLEWGKRNFALNGLDPAAHEFISGDVFDWLRRLGKKGRLFEIILLDPPTFSQSKQSGVFRAEKDYPKLISAALPLLPPGGVLFASTNAESWKPQDFVEAINSAVSAARRTIVQSHYSAQPIDFPISRAEPAYLKTVWLRIG